MRQGARSNIIRTGRRGRTVSLESTVGDACERLRRDFLALLGGRAGRHLSAPALLTEMPFLRSKDRMCLNHCALTAASIVRIWSRLTALSNEERAVCACCQDFLLTLLILSRSAP